MDVKIRAVAKDKRGLYRAIVSLGSTKGYCYFSNKPLQVTICNSLAQVVRDTTETVDKDAIFRELYAKIDALCK
jgi:hypothetical protein